MADRLGIINRALGRIGEPALVGAELTTPTRAAAVRALQFYPETVMETIRAAPWSSAVKRASLLPDDPQPAENHSGFLYAYTLPTDCMNVLKVVDDPEYIIEGRTLYTDSTSIVVIETHYTSGAEATNEALWDAGLAQAIELRLGSKLAFLMTTKLELGDRLIQEAAAIGEDARRSSIYESKTRKKGGVQLFTEMS